MNHTRSGLMEVSVASVRLQKRLQVPQLEKRAATGVSIKALTCCSCSDMNKHHIIILLPLVPVRQTTPPILALSLSFVSEAMAAILG